MRAEALKVARRRLRASVRLELRKLRYEEPGALDDAGEAVHQCRRARAAEGVRSASEGRWGSCSRASDRLREYGRIVLRSAEAAGGRRHRAPYARLLDEARDRARREEEKQEEKESEPGARRRADDGRAGARRRTTTGARTARHHLLPHYLALGLADADGAVPAHVPLADVRSAFRRRALECHPDRAPSPGGADDFRRARAAYDVLLKYHACATPS